MKNTLSIGTETRPSLPTTTNSLFFVISPVAEGIATALLIIDNGIAYITELGYERPITFSKNRLTKIILITSITKAAKKPFTIISVFSFLISNSNAASRTISINPMVPRTGTRLSRNWKLSPQDRQTLY